ncbi:MAG: SIS domain-containing protein [Oscillospiraceae bacterium]|nr:SIS domain-containing protein [Oscillospiraceae bacterium]
MEIMKRYLSAVRDILQTVGETQLEAMEKAAGILARAISEKRSVFTFGTNHAGLLAQELFYRTGGLAVINFIRAPGLFLDVDPPTLTTDMERLPGYGKAIVDANPIGKGDVVLLHSVSGRNAVPIDVALHAREKGAVTICLCNMNTSAEVQSRHSSGKNLHEVCDLVIDNCGGYGDAVLEIGGFPERVAPSSTAVGAAILNAVVARTVELLLEKGITPPVFISSNVPGGDEHNEKIMAEYSGQIHYN